MLYTSSMFLFFVLILSILYFIFPRKFRKYIILIGNIIFYSSFNPKSMLYLIITIFMTRVASYFMEKTKYRKIAFITTLTFNIGLLFFLKFFNYGISIINKFSGMEKFNTLNLLIPLGISFYILQNISYLTDIYKGKIKAEKNLLKYILYMTYFPTIVQGPITRYGDIAENLYSANIFEYRRVKFGIQLVIYGFFKKLVIADRLGLLVDKVFNNYNSYNGYAIILATVAFSFQLYTDFSGCVDICRGISQVLGINLMENFKRPYFTRSIKEFWSAWHISLSTWLRDYVYIPLGGSRNGKLRKYFNIIIVFIISGLWHGTGINYIAWGLLHAGYQIFEDIIAIPTEKIKNFLEKNEINIVSFQQLINFFLVSVAWLFFRANGFKVALKMLKSIFIQNNKISYKLFELGLDKKDFAVAIISLLILYIISFLQSKVSVREEIEKMNVIPRWSIYILSILLIIIFGVYGGEYDNKIFIYMQF